MQIDMLIRMIELTLLHVLVTGVTWRKFRESKNRLSVSILIGILFGVSAIVTNHLSMDNGKMILSVSNISPLAAGLFFSPVSGAIAGLIGGIERIIAGIYWNVGSYTALESGLCTIFAGALGAISNFLIPDSRDSDRLQGVFIGMAAEVIHFYFILGFHRADMSEAFDVISSCALPMIFFTAFGTELCAIVIQGIEHQLGYLFQKVRREDVPLSQLFQVGLLMVILTILSMNFMISRLLGRQKAIQDVHETMLDVMADIENTYGLVHGVQKNVDVLAESLARSTARSIAESLNQKEKIGQAEMDQLREIFNLKSLMLVSEDGEIRQVSGARIPVQTEQLPEVYQGRAAFEAVEVSKNWIAAAVRCREGILQLVFSSLKFRNTLEMRGLADAVTYYHVGSLGFFDILQDNGQSIAGKNQGKNLQEISGHNLFLQKYDAFYIASLFGKQYMCYQKLLFDGNTLFLGIPMEEISENIETQDYELMLSNLILLAVVFILVSMLVEYWVVSKLEKVNGSLAKITAGNLDEEVEVRNSLEFASLSDDINHTVTVLKGYIHAAKQKIERELILAETIQSSALPKNFVFPNQNFDLYALMDPAKEIGGDFYDFFFDVNNRLVLVIADVSGKGIPAALFMMRAKMAIRGKAENGANPAEVLMQANHLLCEGNEGEMFVTVWVGSIDLKSGHAVCANAGHEYPAMMRAGGKFELLKDRHGLPLAVMDGAKYTSYELQMDVGDRLFVYTDGVPEATNPAMEQYGTDRMLEILNRLTFYPMEEVLDALRQNISDFAGKAEQFDDITMLGFAYNGAQQDDRNPGEGIQKLVQG